MVIAEDTGELQAPPADAWKPLMGDDICTLSIRSCDDGAAVEMKSVVYFSYKMYLAAGFTAAAPGTPIDECDEMCVQVGEGDCVPALELALRHARVGDALFVRSSHKFAYGAIGRPASTATTGEVPPYSDLVFEVGLLKTIDVDRDLDGEEGLRLRIGLRKEAGNRWFAGRDFQRAAVCYSKGVSLGDDFFSSGADPHSHPLVLQGYLHCLNNLTACHLGTEQFFKAKEAATKLLSLDPRNVKGLLRAAKATLALADFDECELCLKTVLADEPANVMAQAEMAKLRRARSAYRADARAMEMKIAKGLFAGNAAEKSKLPTAPTEESKESPIDKSSPADSASSPADGAEAITTRTTAINKPERAAGPSNALLLVGTSVLVLALSLLIALYFYGK